MRNGYIVVFCLCDLIREILGEIFFNWLRLYMKFQYGSDKVIVKTNSLLPTCALFLCANILQCLVMEYAVAYM